MKIKKNKSKAIKIIALLLAFATLGTTAILVGKTQSEAYKPPTSELVTPGNIPPGYIKGNGLYYKDAAKFGATDVLSNVLKDTLSGVNVLKKDYNVLLNNNGAVYGYNLGWIDVVNFDNNRVLSVGRDCSQAALRVDMQSLDNEGSIYVFEADFMWRGTGGLNTGNYEYDESKTRDHLTFSFNASSDGVKDSFVKFYGVTNKSDSDNLYLSFDDRNTSTTVLQKAVWYNIRVIYTPIENTMGSIALYINNVFVEQVTVSCNSNTRFETFSIEIYRDITDTEFLLDNVYVSAID